MAPGPDGGAGQVIGHIQAAPARDPVPSPARRRAAPAMDCLSRTQAILSWSADLTTRSRDVIARSRALLDRTAPQRPARGRGDGMGRELWRAEPGGALSAEVGALRLVVEMPAEAGGAVRFLVLNRGAGGGPHALLVDSGHAQDVRAGMAAAEQIAEQCQGR
jgi:hypothetical protein